MFLKTDGAGNLSFDSLSFATPLAVIGNATAGSEIRLPEDTDNGSNYVALKAPNTIASNLTLTLPSADGSSGQVLQTNGSGVLSFAGVSGGKVLQVANFTNTTSYSTTSSSYQDAFSTTFTPTLATSKVLILCTVDSQKANTDCNISLKLLRDGATNVGEFATLLNTNNTQFIASIQSFNLLDTPSTTSAITYKIQFKVGGTGTVEVNAYSRKSTLTFLEIAG